MKKLEEFKNRTNNYNVKIVSIQERGLKKGNGEKMREQKTTTSKQIKKRRKTKTKQITKGSR